VNLALCVAPEYGEGLYPSAGPGDIQHVNRPEPAGCRACDEQVPLRSEVAKTYAPFRPGIAEPRWTYPPMIDIPPTGLPSWAYSITGARSDSPPRTRSGVRPGQASAPKQWVPSLTFHP